MVTLILMANGQSLAVDQSAEEVVSSLENCRLTNNFCKFSWKGSPLYLSKTASEMVIQVMETSAKNIQIANADQQKQLQRITQ